MKRNADSSCMLDASALLLRAVFVTLLLASHCIGSSVRQNRRPQEPACAQRAVMRVCHLLGIPVSSETVIARMPIHNDGNSLLEIQNTLESLGFAAKGYEADFTFLRSCSLPVIVHFKDHFAVLEGLHSTHVRVFDGTGRRKVLTCEDFIAQWDGIVLVIECPTVRGK